MEREMSAVRKPDLPKPAKRRSTATLVRKELKIRGQSDHNGRGVVHMDYDCSPAELVERFNAAVDKWADKGMIEETIYVGPSEENGDHARLTVVFEKDVVTNPYYRDVVLHSCVDKDGNVTDAYLYVKFNLDKWRERGI